MLVCTETSPSSKVHKQKRPSFALDTLRFFTMKKHIKVKVKVKFSLRHLMKAQRGNRITALKFVISALDGGRW
jgi:hypothetical protein